MQFQETRSSWVEVGGVLVSWREMSARDLEFQVQSWKNIQVLIEAHIYVTLYFNFSKIISSKGVLISSFEDPLWDPLLFYALKKTKNKIKINSLESLCILISFGHSLY